MSRQLLLHGADATLVDGAGRTALHCAAVSSNGCEESLDVIQMLAGQKGVHVNTREIRGFTPLFLALEKEYIVTGVVERLLLLGADPNIANFKGRMPLGWVHPKYNDGVYMSDAHVRRLRRLLLKYGAVGDPEPRSASSCGIF